MYICDSGEQKSEFCTFSIIARSLAKPIWLYFSCPCHFAGWRQSISYSCKYTVAKLSSLSYVLSSLISCYFVSFINTSTRAICRPIVLIMVEYFTKLATVPVDEIILNLIFCPNIPRQDCSSDHVMAEQVCTLWYRTNSLIFGAVIAQCYCNC